jgi:hypothetical protein
LTVAVPARTVLATAVPLGNTISWATFGPVVAADRPCGLPLAAIGIAAAAAATARAATAAECPR